MSQALASSVFIKTTNRYLNHTDLKLLQNNNKRNFSIVMTFIFPLSLIYILPMDNSIEDARQSFCSQ